jgi:transposase
MIAMNKFPISERKRLERAELIKNSIVVGIDPASYRHTAVIYTPDRMSQYKVFNIVNNRSGLENFENRLLSIQKQFPVVAVKIAIEASGEYWKPFQHYFQQRGMETIFVPPLFVKRTRDLDDFTPRSNDPKDAVRVANLAFEGRYFNKQEQDEVFENLAHLARIWDTVTLQLTTSRHRIQSLLVAYFPEYKALFSDIISVTSLAILERWPFPEDLCQVTAEQVNEMLRRNVGNGHIDKAKTIKLLSLANESIGITTGRDAARIRLCSLIKQAKFCKKQLAELRPLIRDTLANIDYAEKIKSIYGIGTISTAQFLGYLGDLYNFDKVNQVLDLAGLALIATESGTFKSSRQISHRGRKRLRRVLFEMTFHHKRTPNAARRKYLSCRVKGKTDRQAVIAAIPHLLKTIFAVVKQNK